LCSADCLLFPLSFALFPSSVFADRRDEGVSAMLADERCMAAATVCDVDGAFEQMPCMALIERDGWIVARNALCRRLTGFIDGTAVRVEDVLLGWYELSERRTRFDCLALRRHGAPLPVCAVAQSAMYRGERCRLVLLIEQNASVAGDGYERETSLVEDVLEATPEATAITHGGRVLHVNREFTRLFGYAAAECVGEDLVDLVVPEGRLHECEMMQHTLRKNGRVAMETRRRTRGGAEVDVCVLIAEMQLGGKAAGTLVTYRDIREQKLEEARLKHRARHDVLTGLPNRSLFLEQVGLTLARVRRRPDRRFAVVFMDLDGFKQVNDTMGHAAGDKLLLVVADRLTRCLRPQDTVSRFGGDEFALLLDESGSEAEVEAVAARIQTEIQQAIAIDGVETRVKASMGIAIAQQGYESAEEILLHADSAMYAAKMQGGGRHVTYHWQ
jgi:diguanylate cyclase (GGDEF)-like protein/PAS domain S-box-containing protein